MELTITLKAVAIAGICLLPLVATLHLLCVNRRRLYKLPLLPWYAIMYSFIGIQWYIRGFWEDKKDENDSTIVIMSYLLLATIGLASYSFLIHLCYNNGNLDFAHFFTLKAYPMWADISSFISTLLGGILTITFFVVPVLERK